VLGNGRLGAMDIGGVFKNRIVLNESSLWSGGPYDGNRYGAYECLPEVRALLFAGQIKEAWSVLTRHFRYADGVAGWGSSAQFGCYQTLGDLTLDFTRGWITLPASPSGHVGGSDREGIEKSADGDPNTKWFVPNGAEPIVWQRQWAEPQTISEYAFTSGNDMPDRDPRAWRLDGSTDGEAWVELDRRALEQAFEERRQTKTFAVANPGAYAFYRFTFEPPPARAFQLSDIALKGTDASEQPVVTGYRRDLNLRTGVSTTRYTINGVTYTRELVVSKPDEVIALRLRTDKSGALNVSAGLSRQQQVAYRVEGDAQVMEGQLSFHKPGGGGEGMRYQARLSAQYCGGSVETTPRGLIIEGANEVTLVVSAGTNWINKTFEELVARRMDAAMSKPFLDIHEAAVVDHRQFMDRCQLALPEGPNSDLPTPDRVKAAEQEPDPALAAVLPVRAALMVVSGSRPDSPLPTNLQGIWAEEYSTPWRGDFPQQHQFADELLAGRVRQPFRLPPASAAVHPERGQGRREDGQGVFQRAGLDGEPYAESLVRHGPEQSARLYRADLRRVARPARLAALRLYAGRGVPAGILPRPARRQPSSCRPCWSRIRGPNNWSSCPRTRRRTATPIPIETASGRRPRCASAPRSTNRSPAIC
jgi:hypothetical protein